MLSCADTASEEGSDRELGCCSSCREDDAVSEISADDDSDDETTGDKYLIFTTGYKTYTPHQIGTYTSYAICIQFALILSLLVTAALNSNFEQNFRDFCINFKFRIGLGQI